MGDRAIREREGFLTESAAEAAFQLPRRFLQNRRHRSSGPAFFKVGKRVLYKLTDVEKWLTSCRREAGTSTTPGRGKR